MLGLAWLCYFEPKDLRILCASCSFVYFEHFIDPKEKTKEAANSMYYFQECRAKADHVDHSILFHATASRSTVAAKLTLLVKDAVKVCQHFYTPVSTD